MLSLKWPFDTYHSLKSRAYRRSKFLHVCDFMPSWACVCLHFPSGSLFPFSRERPALSEATGLSIDRWVLFLSLKGLPALPLSLLLLRHKVQVHWGKLRAKWNGGMLTRRPGERPADQNVWSPHSTLSQWPLKGCHNDHAPAMPQRLVCLIKTKRGLTREWGKDFEVVFLSCISWQAAVRWNWKHYDQLSNLCFKFVWRKKSSLCSYFWSRPRYLPGRIIGLFLAF